MEHFPVITHLDEFFQNERVEMPYPCILFKDVGEEFPLVMSCLEEGETPIVLIQDRTTLQLDRKTSNSALNLNKLIPLYKFEIHISPTQTQQVSCVEDLMEVIPWMQ